MVAVGVDGVPGGWLAVWIEAGTLTAQYFSSCASILDKLSPSIMAIDIPIGLPTPGGSPGRRCENEARERLGERRSSVFLTAPRSVIADPALSYAEANARCRALLERGLSKQAFELHGKIREVDSLARHPGSFVIVEVHPELCFRAMAGNVVLPAKRTARGIVERLKVLKHHGLDVASARLDRSMDRPGIQIDDLCDALAALWTAHRVAAGTADRLPAEPEHDECGLRMEMWF